MTVQSWVVVHFLMTTLRPKVFKVSFQHILTTKLHTQGTRLFKYYSSYYNLISVFNLLGIVILLYSCILYFPFQFLITWR